MNEKNNVSHELKMIDRSILSLTGVSKIVSFDSSEFILESNMGPIHIKGEGLELLSLDTQDGVIRIKGKIIGYNYIEKLAKKKEESLIAKLFK
ncbi:MAG: sporulation protein YabP [Firmicutes bacterium]|nr:sporulation protein YabP [Bacillota bacterium]